MKPSFALAAAALALGLAHNASAQEAATQPATAPHPKAPLGRWITESGNRGVGSSPCPPNARGPAGANPGGSGGTTTLCGRVVRVLANRSMSAPGTEMAAADARLALGMTMLSGLRDSGS